jgi:hypothetical protein
MSLYFILRYGKIGSFSLFFFLFVVLIITMGKSNVTALFKVSDKFQG